MADDPIKASIKYARRIIFICFFSIISRTTKEPYHVIYIYAIAIRLALQGLSEKNILPRRARSFTEEKKIFISKLLVPLCTPWLILTYFIPPVNPSLVAIDRAF